MFPSMTKARDQAKSKLHITTQDILIVVSITHFLAVHREQLPAINRTGSVAYLQNKDDKKRGV